MTYGSWFGDNRKYVGTLATLFFASVLSIWLIYSASGSVTRLIYVWPLTGVQLGIMLPDWANRRGRAGSQLSGILGVFVGGWLVGLPSWFALAVGCLSTLDVWIAGSILSKGVHGFEDLKRRENLLLFGLAAMAGPLLAGGLAGIPVALFLHAPFLRTSLISALSDSLGMAVVLPALLFLLTGTYRSPRKLVPHLKVGAPAAILFALAAGGVFWQTKAPLLFMVFPPLVLMVLAMGLEGAVYVSVTLTIIACYATAHGHGPLWLSIVRAGGDRLVLLQAFLWMSVATALPVGALLDERQRAEKAADEARKIYQTLLQNAEDMIVLSSMDGSHRYISPACERLTGWTPNEFMALDRMQTFHPDDRKMAILVMESMMSGKREHMFRYRLAQKKGGWRWVEASARTYFDDDTGAVLGYVGTVRDISELKQSEEIWLQEREQLTRDKSVMADLARTDALTALPNRRFFDEAVQKHVSDRRRHGSKAALMMIDVDSFKLFNDLYGHQAGDACLQSIARTLQGATGRESDVVARWGGEEFSVLLPGADLTSAGRIATTMLEAVRRLGIEHKGNPHGIVTISIGVAGVEAHTLEDPSLWIQQADQALYMSKRSGKDSMTLGPVQPEIRA